MNACVQRFTLQQPMHFFPKRVWPFLLLLAAAYYGSVVEEQRLLFTLLVGLLLCILLVRQKAAAHCVLEADQSSLTVCYPRGWFKPTLFRVEYAWEGLVFFRYKLLESTEYTLQLHWDKWSDAYFSGDELDSFYQYLRTHFPEKEMFSPTAP